MPSPAVEALARQGLPPWSFERLESVSRSASGGEVAGGGVLRSHRAAVAVVSDVHVARTVDGLSASPTGQRPLGERADGGGSLALVCRAVTALLA